MPRRAKVACRLPKEAQEEGTKLTAFCRLFMCSKCDEIDVKIEHLRTIGRRMTDPQTLDGIAVLIAELEAQKVGLHPD